MGLEPTQGPDWALKTRFICQVMADVGKPQLKNDHKTADLGMCEIVVRPSLKNDYENTEQVCSTRRKYQWPYGPFSEFLTFFIGIMQNTD